MYGTQNSNTCCTAMFDRAIYFTINTDMEQVKVTKAQSTVAGVLFADQLMPCKRLPTFSIASSNLKKLLMNMPKQISKDDLFALLWNN